MPLYGREIGSHEKALGNQAKLLKMPVPASYTQPQISMSSINEFAKIKNGLKSEKHLLYNDNRFIQNHAIFSQTAMAESIQEAEKDGKAPEIGRIMINLFQIILSCCQKILIQQTKFLVMMVDG